MPPGSCLFVGDIEYEGLYSPAPESSISAVEQPRSQEPAASSSSSSASTRPSRPKKRKLRTPETWKHFRLPQGDEDTHQNSQRLWYCQHCLNPPWRTVSTTSAKRHMRTGHGTVIDDEERPAKKALQQSLEVAFTRAEEKNRELLSCGEQSILRNTIKLDAFYEAQIQLITRRRLPLNCVSWPEYQALLCAVNPRADEILIQSGTTVLAHIERSYVLHRENIKAQLQAAKSQVHFSIDLWSSPHRKAFLGICGQWVDEHYELREALLGLPNIQHSHSGETMSRHLLDTIRDFNLAGNIGYFTSDNATSNNTCLRALSESLASEFDISKEALCAAIEEADDNMDSTVVESLQTQLQQRNNKGKYRKVPEDQAGWRSMGPLGKLHNIAVFIRNSTVHSDAWQRLAGRALGIDNATRWNSWYMLLRTALEKKDKLMVFQQEHHKALGDDCLTEDDWDVLRLTADFLQPFWQATLAEQKSWSSLDQLLYHMDILLKHFEDAKKTYSNHQRLIHSIHMGWFVLDKYYVKTDETPVYSAALLLHPSKRLKYLRQTGTRIGMTARSGVPEAEMTVYDKLAQSLDVTEAGDDEDELDKFINGSPCKITVSPLAWWARKEQRLEYPRLHKMALNVLSIAPMSDKAERVFSGTRRTISFDRARLGVETIEMTECIGSWNKNSLIRDGHIVS
ncbi:Ribonuclease H-like protein [Metarhizium guizhouense ARSEF 977]|uniref:Ribonuclease H-like protein n=2 Tax=Metarhizium TaxID=5529 RepID=A0A0B4GPY2_METGA|nr:Ribonuclease H-like protein [Metarhizium guizhouense ARSEF 977]